MRIVKIYENSKRRLKQVRHFTTPMPFPDYEAAHDILPSNLNPEVAPRRMRSTGCGFTAVNAEEEGEDWRGPSNLNGLFCPGDGGQNPSNQ